MSWYGPFFKFNVGRCDFKSFLNPLWVDLSKRPVLGQAWLQVRAVYIAGPTERMRTSGLALTSILADQLTPFHLWGNILCPPHKFSPAKFLTVRRPFIVHISYTKQLFMDCIFTSRQMMNTISFPERDEPTVTILQENCSNMAVCEYFCPNMVN